MLQHGYSKNQNTLCKVLGSTDRAVLIEYYYITNSLLIYPHCLNNIIIIIFFFFQSGIQAKIINSVSCLLSLVFFKLNRSSAFFDGIAVLHNVDMFEKFSLVVLHNVLYFGLVWLSPHDQIQVKHFWHGIYISNAVSFPMSFSRDVGTNVFWYWWC